MNYLSNKNLCRAGIIHQNSQRPSLEGSRDLRNRRKNRSIQQENGNKFSQINTVNKLQYDLLYQKIHHDKLLKNQSIFLKQQPSYPWFTINQQKFYCQRNALIQQKIRNVDGINQRMASLNKQLRISQQKYHKFNQQNVITIKPIINKCKSTKIIKNVRKNYQYLQQHVGNIDNSINNFNKINKFNQKQNFRNYHQDNTLENAIKYNQKMNVQCNQYIRQESYIKKIQKTTINSNSQKTQKTQRISFQPQDNRQKQQRQKQLSTTNKQQKIYASLIPNQQVNKANSNDDKKNEHKYVSLTKKINQPIQTNNNCKLYEQNIKGIKPNRFQIGWLKNKVKTIQSQVQTNLKQCEQLFTQQNNNQISFVLKQECRMKQSLTSQHNASNTQSKNNIIDIDKLCDTSQINKQEQPKQLVLNINTNNNKNIQQNLIQNQNKGNNRFQSRVKNITQKIQEYQRKVQNFTLVPKKQYNTNNDEEINNKKQIIVQKQIHKQNSQVWKKNKKLSKNKLNQQNLYEQIWPIKQQQRKIAPTLSYENERKIINKNQQKKLPTFTKSNDQCPKTKQKSAQPTKQLQKRAKSKQNIREIVQKLNKQIQLDNELRKLKKQLKLLPQQVPGTNKIKWEFIQQCYKKYQFNIQQKNVKSIFLLSDQQADPFLSIMVEDLTNYQQIIQLSIKSYIKAQTFFYQNILHKFNKDNLQLIFKKGLISEKFIKLDQFTVLISNTTKDIYKCRDVFLLFNRIIQNIQQKQLINSNNQDGINVEELIYVLSEKDNQNRKVLVKEKYLMGEQKDKQMKINKQLNQLLKFDSLRHHCGKSKIDKSQNQRLFMKGKYR